MRLEPVIYSRGCLPESAVTEVADARECLESMSGVPFPEATWMRQVTFRDFVFLRPHLPIPGLDVSVFDVIVPSTGEGPTDLQARNRIRAALAHWSLTLPEVPILYNPFRPLGGTIHDYDTADGWLCVYRRYPFRDFSGLELG